ncbi:MAG TPA: hypothetical protein VGO40_00450 [Longimicrobium sp.]|jgi:hypothetical protein|nr:hypothetical protein [Longimicrobium sp.]
MRNSNDTGWLKLALSVKEPLQFVAWAFSLPIAVLLAAMLNSRMITTLDRAGLIWLFGIIAFVLTSVLVLGALIVLRQPVRSGRGSDEGRTGR